MYYICNSIGGIFMMKDYDEYLNERLAKIKKDGIMILDPLTGKRDFI